MIKSLYPCFKQWEGPGKTIWVYSDPHFGMTEHDWPNDTQQAELINSRIGKNDTLLLLGDVGDIRPAEQLKGYKVLILGNHDRGRTMYTDVFDEVYDGPIFINDRVVLSHEPVHIPYIFNIHGHDHRNKDCSVYSLNVCANVIGFCPINLDKFIKNGGISHAVSLRESERH